MKKDKLEICGSLLADSIVNFFAGNSVETTIHTAYAALTITRDLCKFFYKGNEFSALNLSSEELAKRDSELLKRPKKGELSDEYNGSLIHLATTIKHADQNALELTTFGGIEGATTLILAIRDYMAMKDALDKQNLLAYDNSSFVNVGGKSAPRLLHLIGTFTDFTDSYKRARTSEQNPTGSSRTFEQQEVMLNDLLDDYYKRICESGLRKSCHKNGGILLVPSWQPKADMAFKAA